jgi:hypothetical protein
MEKGFHPRELDIMLLRVRVKGLNVDLMPFGHAGSLRRAKPFNFRVIIFYSACAINVSTQ